MDLSPLRALVSDINFRTHGVDATVTRPTTRDQAFNDDPVDARAIWVLPTTVDAPGSMDLTRREANRVMAFRRSELASIPRGTIVEAPEAFGGDVMRWRVEGPERIEGDHVRVMVVADPAPY